VRSADSLDDLLVGEPAASSPQQTLLDTLKSIVWISSLDRCQMALLGDQIVLRGCASPYSMNSVRVPPARPAIVAAKRSLSPSAHARDRLERRSWKPPN